MFIFHSAIIKKFELRYFSKTFINFSQFRDNTNELQDEIISG